jgi:hypothetical protein
MWVVGSERSFFDELVRKNSVSISTRPLQTEMRNRRECLTRACCGRAKRALAAEAGRSAAEKRPDTVGQPPRTEIGVPNMPSLKAKKLRKLLREKVLLEL